jgi:hypothetical protein
MRGVYIAPDAGPRPTMSESASSMVVEKG